jgi:hypothetical protein
MRSLNSRVDVGIDIVENRGLGLLGIEITNLIATQPQQL